jgi:hypothetical protein
MTFASVSTALLPQNGHVLGRAIVSMSGDINLTSWLLAARDRVTVLCGPILRYLCSCGHRRAAVEVLLGETAATLTAETQCWRRSEPSPPLDPEMDP